MKFNFAWLAQKSTGRAPLLKGLLPPLTTIIILLGISAAIAGGIWLWMGLTAGALLHTAAMLPLFEKALLGVIGFSLLNTWFIRDITTYLLSSREIREKFVFSKDENPTDVRKLVNHVRHEVNAHFRKIYGKDHQDLPMPRLCTFTDNHCKIVTVEGRNPGKAAIFFSSGVFNYHETKMNQRELAALIQNELVKIYMRRGVSRVLVGLISDFFSTLQNLTSGNLLTRMVGFLAGPLQFFELLREATKRTYEYEAGEVVVKCGRGVDFIRAKDRQTCSTLDEAGTNAELKENQQQHQRKPYQGPFQWFLGPIAKWIDEHELAGDDKTGYRFISLMDILVRELGYYFRELFSEQPRSTNLKAHLRPLISTKIGSDKITMDNAKSSQIADIEKNDIRINKNLWKTIAKQNSYAPIAPNGNGKAKVLGDHHHHDASKENLLPRNSRLFLIRGGKKRPLASEEEVSSIAQRVGRRRRAMV